MIKVMTVFGTRPEAIKMAPVVKELQKHADSIETVVAVTAQHRQMLDRSWSCSGLRRITTWTSWPRARPCTILRRSRSWASRTSWPKNNRIWSSFTVIRRRPLPVPWLRYYQQIPVGHVEAAFGQGYILAVPGRDEPQAHWGHGVHSLCTDLDGTGQSPS